MTSVHMTMQAGDKGAALKGVAPCPSLGFELEVVDSVESMRKDLVAICSKTCSTWAQARAEDPEIVVTQVQGGITNILYLIVNKSLKPRENRSLLVRVFGKKTDLMIDRNRDNGVMRMLSDLDFGPPCHGFFSNGRVEGFYESYCALKPSDMSKPSIMPLIAPELARMHSLPVADHPNSKLIGPKSASLWHTIDSWLEKIKNEVNFGHVKKGGSAVGAVESEIASTKEAEKKRTLELLDVNLMAKEIRWLKSILPTPDDAAAAAAAGGSKEEGQPEVEPKAGEARRTAAIAFTDAVVFSHNDALAGNILYDKTADGGRGDIKLIDFEYGSWNYRGFDIANHFCEFAGFDCDYFRGFPPREEQEAFVSAYIGKDGGFYSSDEEKALFMDAVYGQSSSPCASQFSCP